MLVNEIGIVSMCPRGVDIEVALVSVSTKVNVSDKNAYSDISTMRCIGQIIMKGVKIVKIEDSIIINCFRTQPTSRPAPHPDKRPLTTHAQHTHAPTTHRAPASPTTPQPAAHPTTSQTYTKQLIKQKKQQLSELVLERNRD